MILRNRGLSVLRTSTSGPHPIVQRAVKNVIKLLGAAGIEFSFMGGIAVNSHGIGRPTKDVDILVKAKDWEDSLNALKPITLDRQVMGVPNEPYPGAIVITKEGVPIEVFATSILQKDISTAIGTAKKDPHPSGELRLRLPSSEQDILRQLIIQKLSAYHSASNRLRDLGDVQQLITKYTLTPSYSRKLPESLRETFIKLTTDNPI